MVLSTARKNSKKYVPSMMRFTTNEMLETLVIMNGIIG